MSVDAREALEEYHGVFVDRDCLFISTTGAFLSGYVNCEVLFPHYPVVHSLVTQLLDPFLDEGVQGFACASTGDIVLLQYATIWANEHGVPTIAVWADKRPDNSYVFERNGFPQALESRRVLVLNDRISTGGTTRKVINDVRRCGGEVMGVATFAGVSSLSAETFGVPALLKLCDIDVQAHAPDQLPEEWLTMPIAVDEALGHGSEFKTKNPDWAGGFVTLLS